MDPAQPQGEPAFVPQIRDSGEVKQERELVKWMAAGRPYQQLNRQLFTTAVVIAGLVSVILIFAGEWMLILVLAAMLFAYYVWSTVPPEEVEYVITTKGVLVHGRVTKWEMMTRWWMEEKWGQKMVGIEVPGEWPGRMWLVVKPEVEEGIKETLGKYVEMEKPEATQADKMGKWLAEKFPLEAR